MGPAQVEEHLPLIAEGTAILQVGGQRLAEILGQRQNALPVILASAHQESALPPVEILQAKTNDFAGAESQTSQQQ